jgi:hypothetical protein
MHLPNFRGTGHTLESLIHLMCCPGLGLRAQRDARVFLNSHPVTYLLNQLLHYYTHLNLCNLSIDPLTKNLAFGFKLKTTPQSNLSKTNVIVAAVVFSRFGETNFCPTLLIVAVGFFCKVASGCTNKKENHICSSNSDVF